MVSRYGIRLVRVHGGRSAVFGVHGAELQRLGRKRRRRIVSVTTVNKYK